MPRAVVEGKALDELCVGGSAVLHLHDLNHVQIGLLGGLVDSEDGIDDRGGQRLGKAGTQLCGERGSGDGEEELTVDFAGKLELVEEL